MTKPYEPETYRTEDGYTFVRQHDGSYSDGDLSYSSWADLYEVMEIDS